ncbi:MAG: bifunctional 2-C-methyl-D-erythritol 4-phosphate cytidylyltransferase/2-C-methyl-D-erythritol 2,4-cyclodiphosphate synthase [Rickettsiales bacterium]|nr:bifunctional 2-C-methyl-D-erythritol 4-phosphate cytidylyltransferase/2-C-methyl-D-erythritol 2,4-cyclodiphosphate synthase [Rickettsiales bacterium]
MKIAALVVAAGHSRRMGGEVPKPYMMLDGQPVLRHSVKALLAHPAIDSVRVVRHADHTEWYVKAIDGLDVKESVIGGVTRQQSVKNGLDALEDEAPDIILIHDAARPGLTSALIDRIIEAMQTHRAVIPVLPVNDTIKRQRKGVITETLVRDELCAVQTPQAFRYDLICKAHAEFTGDATDDASIAEAADIPVHTVLGEATNAKLTTPEDWSRMMANTPNLITKVGQGFDVHALEESDKPMMVCGIEIDTPLSLKGHSDADVGLHAAVDAILGALGAGDIGQHFPPSDDQWKGAPSSAFIEHAITLMQEAGGTLDHLDITLICEKPKVGPHREAMRKCVAKLCGVPISHISIKATTTEKLGFTGRGEGMAAQAVATLRVPSGETTHA